MNNHSFFSFVFFCSVIALGPVSVMAAGQSSQPTSPSNPAHVTDNAQNQSLETNTAPVFPDSARIILIDQSGQELDIGGVMFSASSAQSTHVSVEMNHDNFVDQFLSMRPFRCLTDPAEWFCYLPYPYELNKTITPDDMTDLEYQLLFIWKSPRNFGIDAWNGVYYKLELGENGTINSQLLQGDLNVLANPPEPYSYPIDLNEFISDGAKNRLFPSLVIRP